MVYQGVKRVKLANGAAKTILESDLKAAGITRGDYQSMRAKGEVPESLENKILKAASDRTELSFKGATDEARNNRALSQSTTPSKTSQKKSGVENIGSSGRIQVEGSKGEYRVGVDGYVGYYAATKKEAMSVAKELSKRTLGGARPELQPVLNQIVKERRERRTNTDDRKSRPN